MQFKNLTAEDITLFNIDRDIVLSLPANPGCTVLPDPEGGVYYVVDMNAQASRPERKDLVCREQLERRQALRNMADMFNFEPKTDFTT